MRKKIVKLFQAAERSMERFPLSVFFAFALTVCSIILTHTVSGSLDEKWMFFLWWYPSTGMILSFGLTLWIEEHRNSTLHSILVAFVHIVWIGVSLLLTDQSEVLLYAPFEYVVMTLMALLIIAVPSLSFLRDKNDVPCWNFCIKLMRAFATALVIAALVCGGVELLILSMEKLFDAAVNTKMKVDIAIVCFFLLAPVLFIQAVPEKNYKHKPVVMPMPKLIVNAVTKLFASITAAYLLTLYCYAAKILFTWQLPDGWVSRLVIVSMLCFLLLFAMVYPYREKAMKGESAWDRMVVKFITCRMPLLLLPLLVLMSIGIARRISDYGISIMRLYLVALNLWCYVVCIVLAIKRDTRILWIPLSFVLTFAALSLFPINVSTYVKKNIETKISATLLQNAWNGIAMNNDEYNELLISLDNAVAKQIDGRLHYLKRQYSYRSVEAFIENDVLTGGIDKILAEQENNEMSVRISCYRKILGDCSFDLPSHASKIQLYEAKVDLGKDCIKDNVLDVRLPVVIDKNDSLSVMYEFRIALYQLQALEMDSEPMNLAVNGISHVEVCIKGRPVESPCRNIPTSVMMYLNTFDLNYNGEKGHFYVSGPLFILSE